MATVGSMVVNLIANTGRFQKGMRKSREQMKEFSRTFRSNSEQVARVAPQMSMAIITAAGAATAAIVRMIARMNEADAQFTIAADAMVKQSRTVGLYAQQYKELRYAVEQSGGSTQQFNTGIQYLVRNIGQGISAFQEMGISLEKLRLLDTHQQFLTVADAISQIENQTDQAAKAYQIFGRGGMAMLETLRLGREGLNQYAEEQRRLSGVISAGSEVQVAAAKASIDRVAEARRGYEDARAASNAWFTEKINQWRVSYWQGRQWLNNFLSPMKDTYTEIYAEMDRVAKEEQRMVNAKQQRARAEEMQAAQAAADRAALVETEFERLGIVLGDLKDEVIGGYDQFDLMLKHMDWRAKFTRQEYAKARDIIKEIRDLTERRAEMLKPEDIAVSPTIGAATAQQLRSQVVSVAGLQVGGVVDKQDTTNQLLQEQNRLTRELISDIRMN